MENTNTPPIQNPTPVAPTPQPVMPSMPASSGGNSLLTTLSRFKFLIGVFVLAVLAIAVPLTLNQVRKIQESRSHASGEAVAVILDPLQKNVQIGKPLNIKLKLNGGQNNVTAVDVKITYDPEKLGFVSGQSPCGTNELCAQLDSAARKAIYIPSNNYSTVLDDETTPGTIHLVLVNENGTSIIGSNIDLGTLGFTAQGEGSTTVGFSDIHVNAAGIPGALPIDTNNTKNGTYVVTNGPATIRDFLEASPNNQLTYTCDSNCNGLTNGSLPFTITDMQQSVVHGYYNNDTSKTWRIFDANGLDDITSDFQLAMPGGDTVNANIVLHGTAKLGENNTLQGTATTSLGQVISWTIKGSSFGQACGGNTSNPPQCADGYTCTPRPGENVPFGDVGGVCVPNSCTSNNSCPFGFTCQEIHSGGAIGDQAVGQCLPGPTSGNHPITIQYTLEGVGNGPANLGLNANPKNADSFTDVSVLDNNGKQVDSASIRTSYDPQTGIYSGGLDLWPNFVPGIYTIKIRTSNSLWKTIPVALNLTADSNNIVLTPVRLVTGDLDRDNVLTILDYNAFISCTDSNNQDSGQPILKPNCSNADFNADGKVEELDNNILLYGFAHRNGD